MTEGRYPVAGQDSASTTLLVIGVLIGFLATRINVLCEPIERIMICREEPLPLLLLRDMLELWSLQWTFLSMGQTKVVKRGCNPGMLKG